MEGKGFTLIELLVVVAIIAILMALLLPALSLARDKAREARCIANLRQTGIGLQMWFDNSSTYPGYDYVSSPLTNAPNLGPWTDALALRSPEWDPNCFTIQNIESCREWYKERGRTVDVFIKAVDNADVFKCPADKPHPHRINQGRAQQWGFWRNDQQDGYEHSYALGVRCYNAGMGNGTFAKNASAQVLACDGVWNWCQNFTAYYLDDPNAQFNTGGWYCNCMGYFHGNYTRATLVCRDGSVKSVAWRTWRSIDTYEAYFGRPGEPVDVFY